VASRPTGSGGIADLLGHGQGAPRQVQQLLVLLVALLYEAREAPDLLVSPRICCESPSSCLFCSSSSCTVLHYWSAMTCRLASARFWLIMTKVERKIASSETIIVSSPNG
jgi:hypothetical protein